LLTFCRPLRPPPRSTLFPYTTLFRSQRIEQRQKDQPCSKREDPVAEQAVSHQRRGDRVAERIQPRPPDAIAHLIVDRDVTVADRDRKSTRLNSSHVKISYAVFCLKKK